MKVAVLDIGATSIKSGIIENGELTKKKETPSNAQLGGTYIAGVAKKIITDYSDFNCIGISTVGQIDSEQGEVRYAKNIPNYTGMKLREIFQDTFNVPVVVENDVNAAALGEAVFGTGQKTQNKTFLCLTYGTGVGGAIVIDEKIFKVASFSAGEFAYLITHGGKNGFYEKYASTDALTKSVQAVIPALTNGKDIFMNLEQPVVKEIVDNWINEVIYGLASLINIFYPSLVILGGGIMKEDYIIKSINEKIYNYLIPSFNKITIAPAALGNDAGLWGVGHLAENLIKTRTQEKNQLSPKKKLFFLK